MSTFFIQKLQEANNYYNDQDLFNLRRISYDIDMFFQKEYQNLINQQFHSLPKDMSTFNEKLTELQNISSFFKTKVLELENSLGNENRLNDIQKNQVYHLYSSGLYDQNYLATIFGVTQPTISKIISNFSKK